MHHPSNARPCKLVDITCVRKTFNSRTDLFGLLQYRLDLAITLRYLTYEAINVSTWINRDFRFSAAQFNLMAVAIGRDRFDQ